MLKRDRKTIKCLINQKNIEKINFIKNLLKDGNCVFLNAPNELQHSVISEISKDISEEKKDISKYLSKEKKDISKGFVEKQEFINVNFNELKDESGNIYLEKIKRIVRRAIKVKFIENLRIIEGQITELNTSTIKLKTTDMESQFEIGNEMLNEIQRERVKVGDVIKFYKDFCHVKNIGQAVSINNNETSEEMVNIPVKEIIKTEVNESIINLDEIDIINSSSEGVRLINTNVFIDDVVREEVDNKINRWIKEDKIEIRRDFLLINCGDLYLDEKVVNYIVEIIKNISKKEKVSVLFLSNGELTTSSNKIDLGIKFDLDPLTDLEVMEVLRNFFKENQIYIEESVLQSVYKSAIDFGILHILNVVNFFVEDSQFKNIQFFENLDFFKRV